MLRTTAVLLQELAGCTPLAKLAASAPRLAMVGTAAGMNGVQLVHGLVDNAVPIHRAAWYIQLLCSQR